MLKLRISCVILALLLSNIGFAKTTSFSFGVIRDAYPNNADDTLLLRTLALSEKEPLSFSVLNGIKGAHEDCSDLLYNERLSLLDAARKPIILSLTGNDWISCMGNDIHESIANERLQRIRELFFNNNTSLGATSIRVLQESNNPEFRSYAENMQWELQGILFATLNVPTPDNHFVMRGGHNSEFEDRQVANREWIKRLFIMAKAKKAEGIVIFTDADIFTSPSPQLFSLKEMPDGFAHIRNLVSELSEQYSGHVLLISNQTSAKRNSLSHITWHKRLGHINTNAVWLKVTVDSKSKVIFSIKKEQSMSAHELSSLMSSTNKKQALHTPQTHDLSQPIISGR